MCLKFLDNPGKRGERWLRYGGLQTLASFGVGWTSGGNLTQTRDALAETMGEDLIAWLRGLPVFWISGNVAVVHAGADPAVPIGTQPTRNLIWGHPDFDSLARSDGMWVLHGHTSVPNPEIRGGRVSIDTGAYATGRLTLAKVTRAGIKFLTV